MLKLLLSLLTLALLSGPALAIDHSPFDALLQQHVHGDRVDYAGFKNNPQFEAYIQAIAATDPATVGDAKARLAFWINAYNALAIHGVLKHPGLKSVADAAPDFGFFKQKTAVVGGEKIALNDIENTIVRPRFKDPRVHAALNCASRSCPPLQRRAFTAAQLDAQLDAAMGAFINDATRNKIGADGLHISEIFNWYKADFTAAGGVQAFLAKYLKGEAQQHALAAKSIKFLKYDWTLNQR
jgi:hypothetical protein